MNGNGTISGSFQGSVNTGGSGNINNSYSNIVRTIELINSPNTENVSFRGSLSTPINGTSICVDYANINIDGLPFQHNNKYSIALSYQNDGTLTNDNAVFADTQSTPYNSFEVFAAAQNYLQLECIGSFNAKFGLSVPNNQSLIIFTHNSGDNSEIYLLVNNISNLPPDTSIWISESIYKLSNRLIDLLNSSFGLNPDTLNGVVGPNGIRYFPINMSGSGGLTSYNINYQVLFDYEYITFESTELPFVKELTLQDTQVNTTSNVLANRPLLLDSVTDLNSNIYYIPSRTLKFKLTGPISNFEITPYLIDSEGFQHQIRRTSAFSRIKLCLEF